MSADSYPWPLELRVDRAAKTLTVAFDDGASFTLPAEFLRVESPSAEVQERLWAAYLDALAQQGLSREP